MPDLCPELQNEEVQHLWRTENYDAESTYGPPVIVITHTREQMASYCSEMPGKMSL